MNKKTNMLIVHVCRAAKMLIFPYEFYIFRKPWSICKRKLQYSVRNFNIFVAVGELFLSQVLDEFDRYGKAVRITDCLLTTLDVVDGFFHDVIVSGRPHQKYPLNNYEKGNTDDSLIGIAISSAKLLT